MKKERIFGAFWLMCILGCINAPFLRPAFQEGNEYTSYGNLEKDCNPSDVSTDLVYQVDYYLVIAEIVGNDIKFQIDIKYQVWFGIKTSGFKRFLPPSGSLSWIDTSSIQVIDEDGTNLDWNYREFSGQDGNNYREISFTHPGFSGVRTISMYFIGRCWLKEGFEDNSIELLNFGTFGINVLTAEYRIVFPEGFTPLDISCPHPGTGSLEEVGSNRFMYKHVQSSYITNNMEISYTPKSSTFLPLMLICLAIPSILVSIAIARSKKGKDHGPPITGVFDLSPVEISYLKCWRGNKKSITVELVQVAMMELSSKGYIEDHCGMYYKVHGNTPEGLDAFTREVLNSFPAFEEKESLDSIVKSNARTWLLQTRLPRNELKEKGILKRARGLKGAPWLAMLLGICIMLLASFLGVNSWHYIVMGVLSIMIMFLVTVVQIHHMTGFSHYTLSPKGRRVSKDLNTWLEDFKKSFERKTIEGWKHDEMLGSIKDNIIYLHLVPSISYPSRALDAWIAGLVANAGGQVLEISYMTRLKQKFRFTSDELFPPPPSAGGGCGGCGGGCGGCGGGGCGGCGG